MSGKSEKLLIKRYASRRLYNAETSDYVTLDDIAGFVRDGRDIEIIDLKSGDDLTRTYLLQIIAEHEGRGENVLPVEVLTDLVRSYTNQAQSVVPQFLAMSFEMLRDGQSKIMENIGEKASEISGGVVPNPLAQMPGFAAMQEQQQAFIKAMMGGWSSTASEKPTQAASPDTTSDLDDIRSQLAELQAKLSGLG